MTDRQTTAISLLEEEERKKQLIYGIKYDTVQSCFCNDKFETDFVESSLFELLHVLSFSGYNFFH